MRKFSLRETSHSANKFCMQLAPYLESKKPDGLTLSKLARLAKVGLSHLHDIKTGRRVPSLAVAVRIEMATDGQVTPRELFEVSAPDQAAA